MPRLPRGAKARTGLAPDAEAYRGRTHAVGTLSFGAACELETVSKLVSSFFRAFCPRDGMRVRVSRGTRSEVLPSRFTPTAGISAKQLAQGGSVELTSGDFEVPLHPLFWVASRPPPDAPTDDDDQAVRLSVGWCVGRPAKERPELAVAEAMSAMIEAAVDAQDCLSALVTAQGRPFTMASAALPYESLAGTAERAGDARWLRTHVRSPGWQLLVPSACGDALSGPAPEGVSLERVRSGSLVRVDAPTPFGTTSTEALERWLLPVLGP